MWKLLKFTLALFMHNVKVTFLLKSAWKSAKYKITIFSEKLTFLP